jgi:hypothetical protein
MDTEEITKETVKPLRGECRDAPAGPVVTMLVCFFSPRTRLRVRPAPGIPCSLLISGTERPTTRARWRGGNEVTCFIAPPNNWRNAINALLDKYLYLDLDDVNLKTFHG